ncbi:unnamed protein product [marine sediment metagenome]|uniref:Uncharacterized protein n=1 Tax=marine sediment metagenome TaxID=412755 RepID=X0ZEX0_9ZZZZ
MADNAEVSDRICVFFAKQKRTFEPTAKAVPERMVDLRAEAVFGVSLLQEDPWVFAFDFSLLAPWRHKHIKGVVTQI